MKAKSSIPDMITSCAKQSEGDYVELVRMRIGIFQGMMRRTKVLEAEERQGINPCRNIAAHVWN